MYVMTFYAVFIILLGLFIPAEINTATAASEATGSSKQPSTFEYCDTQDGSTQQIIFKATTPITCKKQVNNETHQFVVEITGLKLSTIDQTTINKKITPLLAKGYIRDFSLEAGDESSTFTFTFAPNRTVINPETSEQDETKNSVLIRSCAYEKQFTIDIYPQTMLNEILSKTSPFIRLASLDKKAKGPLLAMNKASNIVPLRIMIDPGHGGKDVGATSHNGLTEKFVALDISKRVHQIMQQRNYPTYLTRNNDTEVPLAERAMLASQMGANLVVAIHANGAVNPQARGIEAYYFQAKELLKPDNINFVFINQSKNREAIQKLQEQVGIMANGSYQLAGAILEKMQEGTAGTTTSRGLKPETFRMFLQNSTLQIPAALVEVGFLTNPQEANLLAKKSYRKKIAQHIADGITSFITSHAQL